LTPANPQAGLNAVTQRTPGHPAQAAALQTAIEPTLVATASLAATDHSLTALPDATDPTITLLSTATGQIVTIKPDAKKKPVDAGGVEVTNASGGEQQITEATAKGGVQVITISQNAKTARKIRFTTTIPDGTGWVPQSNGQIYLMPKGGGQPDPIMVLAAPWAVDANGVSLPTSYTVKGKTIIQTIDTKGAAFPIVSDPDWWWWTATIAGCTIAVGTFLTGILKAPAILAKAQSIINSSRTLTNIVNQLGGIKGTLNAIVAMATKKANPTVVALVKNFVNTGGKMLMDALSIGSCYQLIKAM